MYRRHFPVPESSFFLFGPRGTGKSTLLKYQLDREVLLINLLQPDVYRRLSAFPERLNELVSGAPEGMDVVVDEVQRVPELLNVVHDLIERDVSRRFILTGSSARKLRRGGVDLLAGRALNCSLHPFMASELQDFDFEAALNIGLVPLVIKAAEPQEVLRTYADLYLREEVQFEGWARRIGDFARFLEAISFSHGSQLNITHVARECEIGRKTVSGYVEVLEDLLLSFRVPVFSKRARRQTVSHPKFYFFDAGVYRSLRPRGLLDRPEEIDGAAFEGLVGQHLRAWIAYRRDDSGLFYWRTRAGLEVDFIVYGASGFWAIEVKNSSRVRSGDLKSLRAFKSDYPECDPVLVYRGKERLQIDGILCIPGADFLRQIHPNRGLLDGSSTEDRGSSKGA